MYKCLHRDVSGNSDYSCIHGKIPGYHTPVMDCDCTSYFLLKHLCVSSPCFGKNKICFISWFMQYKFTWEKTFCGSALYRILIPHILILTGIYVPMQW